MPTGTRLKDEMEAHGVGETGALAEILHNALNEAGVSAAALIKATADNTQSTAQDLNIVNAYLQTIEYKLTEIQNNANTSNINETSLIGDTNTIKDRMQDLDDKLMEIDVKLTDIKDNYLDSINTNLSDLYFDSFNTHVTHLLSNVTTNIVGLSFERNLTQLNHTFYLKATSVTSGATVNIEVSHNNIDWFPLESKNITTNENIVIFAQGSFQFVRATVTNYVDGTYTLYYVSTR